MTEPAVGSTHVIAAAELAEPVRQALGVFADRHGLADLVGETTTVVRTLIPAVPHRRWARAAAQAETYAMVSGALLVVVTTSGEATVTAWRLAGADVRRITQQIGGTIVTGLQVTALRPGGSERQAIFVALAADRDGSDFEAALRDAITS